MMMTEKQARVARALARYFGHEWAWVNATDGLCDVEAIRAATIAARSEDQWAGIEAPVMVGELVIHTTTSGRVTYAVGPGGVEEIIVTRPVSRTARDLCGAVEDRLEELVPYVSRRPESIRGRAAKKVIDAIAGLEQALWGVESHVCLTWRRWSLYQPEAGDAPAHERHWDALCCVLSWSGDSDVKVPSRPDWILPDEPLAMPPEEEVEPADVVGS